MVNLISKCSQRYASVIYKQKRLEYTDKLAALIVQTNILTPRTQMCRNRLVCLHRLHFVGRHAEYLSDISITLNLFFSAQAKSDAWVSFKKKY